MKLNEDDLVIVEYQKAVGSFGLDCAKGPPEWSDPKPIWTSQGRLIELVIDPTMDVTDAWRRQRDALNAAGFNLWTEEFTWNVGTFLEEVDYVPHVTFRGKPDDDDPVYVALQWALKKCGVTSDEKLEWEFSEFAENASGYKRLEIQTKPDCEAEEIWSVLKENADENEDKFRKACIYYREARRNNEVDTPWVWTFWCCPDKIGISEKDLEDYRNLEQGEIDTI